MRGDVHELKSPKDAQGHEQRGRRYGVIVQCDSVPTARILVAPTSTGAGESMVRPEVLVQGRRTKVLVEQTRAVDPGRLGKLVGHLLFDEIRAVDAALREVLGLDR